MTWLASPWVVVGAASLVAFFVGALSPATIIARALRGDLSQGSGNPGATNAGRVLGLKWGVVVAVLDVAKGFVPTVLALLMLGRLVAYAVGGACVLGHIVSPYLRGRGGKGVATCLGAVLAVFPWLALAMVVVFALLLWRLRWVAGASVVCCLLLGLYAAAWPLPEPVLAGRVWGVGLALLVIGRHHANIRSWAGHRLG
ncbi:MAG TPA: glycerol-3-phosphate acyltransferase [Dermatophilaceae bacterium]|nr:glycerol-3-phosphate acyltransferase [Dermatophilaceae bacterium]